MYHLCCDTPLPFGAQSFLAGMPMGRFGRVEEVANVIAFGERGGEFRGGALHGDGWRIYGAMMRQ